MKILHLTLKRKWFDLIASGHKTYEIREAKPYWEKRLLHGLNNEPNVYDEVHFTNGYGKHRPFVRVSFREILFTGRKWFTPKHGEEVPEHAIIIMLGPVLEVRL